MFSLIDSGSDLSIISFELFEKLGLSSTLKPYSQATSVTGQTLDIKGCTYLQFYLGTRKFKHEFVVINHIVQNAIIGSDFLDKYGARLDFASRTLSLGKMVVLLNDRPSKNTTCHLIEVAETTAILPNTSLAFQCHVKDKVKPGLYLLEPLENVLLLRDEPGLNCAASVLEITGSGSDNDMLVFAQNNAYHPFVLEKGQVCGVMTPIHNKQVSSVEALSADKHDNNQTGLSSNNNNSGQVQGQQGRIQPSILKHVPKEQKPKLTALLSKYQHLFAEKDTDLGKTHLVEMDINTGDHAPIRQRPYKCPIKMESQVQSHIEQMLNSNIISESSSPWASPIVIVPKKDGSSRFCMTQVD